MLILLTFIVIKGLQQSEQDPETGYKLGHSQTRARVRAGAGLGLLECSQLHTYIYTHNKKSLCVWMN